MLGNSTVGSFPSPLSRIVGFSGISLSELKLLHLLLLLLFLTVVKNLSLYVSSLSINAFMLKSGEALRERCLQRFLELEIPFYERVGVGELLGYVNEQSQRSEKLFSSVLEFLREILFVSFLAIFLISLSPSLTTVTGVSLVFVAFALKFVIKGVQRNGRKTAYALDIFAKQVSEVLSGIRVIKAFSSEDRESLRLKQALKRRCQAELSAYKFNSAIHPLTETTGILVLIGIILLGNVFSDSSTELTLSVMLTYILTLSRLLPRVNHLNGLRSSLSLLGGSFETIDRFLSDTKNGHLIEGTEVYKKIDKVIKLSRVCFTYPSNSEPVLRDLSLVIPKGKVTALVGQSGSGKSTIIDLLLRFYDPDSGSIFVDDTDLRSLKRKSWHHAIAVVGQDTFLFNATVRENIAYGYPNATNSAIIEAARQAHALDFIELLPHNFETVVGNRGSMLSGGQRQRIAIARAILCDPDILILDEATSALDSNSERLVQQAIEKVSCGRTVIVVAHRLSTIEKADNIVVMQEGQIVEQGTHQQLIVLKGMYDSLYRMQSISNNDEHISLTAG
nr:ABC transporter ATP-binding protein [Adonisia turfae]